MSIGRRLIDLARSELNSLLDRAARSDGDGDDDDRPHDHSDDGWGGSLGRLSDKELEEELERRRQARQEAERAARGPRRPADARASGGGSGAASGGATSGRRRPEFRRHADGEDGPIRRAYAALEVPPGSDFETVRRAYRTMMRKYHPDLHASSPEKQKAANELAQRLTESYKLLEKRLRK